MVEYGAFKHQWRGTALGICVFVCVCLRERDFRINGAFPTQFSDYDVYV